MKRGIRFYIYTLGCPKNEVDSEIITSNLIRNGFLQVESPDKADVILVNSCGFIKDSKEESIDTIFSFHRARRKGQKIIMLGCLAQRYKDEIEKLMPEIDGFIGSDKYTNIVDIVKGVISEEIRNEYLGDLSAVSMLYESGDRVYRPSNKSYTYVKIADGCSNRCAFCAIPFIKGGYRSRKIDDIVQEIEMLINSGYKEIGVVSQDLTAYGFDLELKNGLLTLLREIDNIRGDFWIRLYYLYPRRIDKKILELIAGSEKILHYIDIPLQHISDRILKSMKRGHTSNFIKGLIKNIRIIIPDVVIRSAFIVGFPDESRRDFEMLKEFLNEYRIENVGFFGYSDEEGTAAYKYTQKVHPQTIKSR
ncbi:MAG: 30S ribosomal protein S12 methylthiotransferase RimO [Myxococcota bacterium]